MTAETRPTMMHLLKASILSWIGALAMLVAAIVPGGALAIATRAAGVGGMAQITSFTNLGGLVGSPSDRAARSQCTGACSDPGTSDAD